MLTRTRWPRPRIVAHRGAGALAPENTLVALRLAASLGFAGVEVDARLAACGTPVLMHDDTLERTTDGRGRVEAHALEALRRLDAGVWYGNEFAGERVPTLEAACTLCRAQGQWMNVEVKPGTDAARTGSVLAAALARHWGEASPAPVLSSFSDEALAAAGREAPQLPRGLLVDGPGDWSARARGLGCVAVHVRHDLLDGQTVEALHEAGLAVVAWTVNEPGLAAALLDWGVDALVTDELRELGPGFATLHGQG